MEIKDINKWEEFAPVIHQLREQYSQNKHPLIFRGMACSSWKLKTTLERATKDIYTVSDYFQTITESINQIESFTGKKWGLKDFPEIKKDIEEHQTYTRVYLPNYDLLVYLRHHGYPSPLLDWSESPYIAAYFALHETISETRVAVFAYIGSPNGGWGGRVGDSIITRRGPYVSTDSRHFAQKARYTVATRFDKIHGHIFCSHEDVFKTDDMNQYLVQKITIPISERNKALNELNDFKINHFTLFQSEDSLIKSLAIRSFITSRT